MATRAQVIDATTAALAGELDVKVFGPNRNEDIPEPTSDPNNPTSWISWALGEEELEAATGGSRLYRGNVDFALLTEHGGGELDYASYSTEIEGLMLGATTGDLHFYEAHQGDVVQDEAWSGRLLSVPYLRQEEKS